MAKVFRLTEVKEHNIPKGENKERGATKLSEQNQLSASRKVHLADENVKSFHGCKFTSIFSRSRHFRAKSFIMVPGIPFFSLYFVMLLRFSVNLGSYT
jgi:hypothetical protein